MSSTAETPSIEQKGSCRCSREPPWKISKECSEFKSWTPRFAPRLAESVAFRAATRPLTGQQWVAIPINLLWMLSRFPSIHIFFSAALRSQDDELPDYTSAVGD